MKRRNKRNWIKMNDDSQNQVSEPIAEKKEEKEMGFFAKHKKGLIIGTIGALAAGTAGLFLASKKGSDDVEEDDDFEDFVDEDIEKELDAEEAEA